ncbi:MAG TPA: hypothetical protein PLE24_02490 [Chitinispirillaceae bacterium]|jgi:hypothetical protein|nr:hypothetical protein [Chitinispirillaceae bacterium]
MTNVEDIKALVRARINAYIAANPGVPGIAFVHGDYLIEEILDDLIGNTKVKAFWDPTESLPADPQELDRYIASATGSGWTENNAYTRIGSDWLETVFAPGIMVCYVESEDEWYGAYIDGWKKLGSGASAQQNPLPIGTNSRLKEYIVNGKTELWIELRETEASSWVKKARYFF